MIIITIIPDMVYFAIRNSQVKRRNVGHTNANIHNLFEDHFVDVNKMVKIVKGAES